MNMIRFGTTNIFSEVLFERKSSMLPVIDVATTDLQSTHSKCIIKMNFITILVYFL